MTSNDTGRSAQDQGGQVARAIAVLEAVAEHGSSTARGISEATSIPLPTVYRIAQELIRSEYLVHLRTEKRFALGYKLHRLAVGLHDDLGIPRSVREEVHAMHRDLGMAAYLAIHRGTDFVVVHVSDTGIGLAEAHLEKVFEPFVQVSGAVSSDDGVGLGLSISRDLARAMGGDIVVRSELGVGSTFTVKLPAAR